MLFATLVCVAAVAATVVGKHHKQSGAGSCAAVTNTEQVPGMRSIIEKKNGTCTFYFAGDNTEEGLWLEQTDAVERLDEQLGVSVESIGNVLQDSVTAYDDIAAGATALGQTLTRALCVVGANALSVVEDNTFAFTREQGGFVVSFRKAQTDVFFEFVEVGQTVADFTFALRHEGNTIAQVASLNLASADPGAAQAFGLSAPDGEQFDEVIITTNDKKACLLSITVGNECLPKLAAKADEDADEDGAMMKRDVAEDDDDDDDGDDDDDDDGDDDDDDDDDDGDDDDDDDNGDFQDDDGVPGNADDDDDDDDDSRKRHSHDDDDDDDNAETIDVDTTGTEADLKAYGKLCGIDFDNFEVGAATDKGVNANKFANGIESITFVGDVLSSTDVLDNGIAEGQKAYCPVANNAGIVVQAATDFENFLAMDEGAGFTIEFEDAVNTAVVQLVDAVDDALDVSVQLGDDGEASAVVQTATMIGDAPLLIITATDDGVFDRVNIVASAGFDDGICVKSVRVPCSQLDEDDE